MCGRYYFKSETVQNALPAEYQPLPGIFELVKEGEVFPTAVGLVITKNKTLPMRFGAEQSNHQGLFINARSEQIMERHSFKTAFVSQPCVVITNGFYEWNDHEKYYITHDDPIMYLGAFYLNYQDKFGKTQVGFVILTTDASPSMAKIHDRMPVIIKADQIKAWLNDQERINLAQSVGLEVQFEPTNKTYHQPSLFD